MSVAEALVATWQFAGGMDEGLIVTIARDVLRGLEYLHRHELAHRDLKVRNRLAPSSAERTCHSLPQRAADSIQQQAYVQSKGATMTLEHSWECCTNNPAHYSGLGTQML